MTITSIASASGADSLYGGTAQVENWQNVDNILNATTFVITPYPATAVTGTTINLTVQAKDDQGNNASALHGVAITGQFLNFVSVANATIGSLFTTFDSTGKATSNITSNVAGTYTITAVGLGTSNITTVAFVRTSPITDPDVAAYDTDFNGIISKSEAVQSVVDYFNSVITKVQAVKVVVAYFTPS